MIVGRGRCSFPFRASLIAAAKRQLSVVGVSPGASRDTSCDTALHIFPNPFSPQRISAGDPLSGRNNPEEDLLG
jgi:hypothetical protein